MVIVPIATTVKVGRTVLAPAVGFPTMDGGLPTESGLSDSVTSTTTGGREEGRSDEKKPSVVDVEIVSITTGGVDEVGAIVSVVVPVGVVPVGMVLVVPVVPVVLTVGVVPVICPSSQVLPPSPDPKPLPEKESIDPSLASTVTLNTW